jgi:hypothetical protein
VCCFSLSLEPKTMIGTPVVILKLYLSVSVGSPTVPIDLNVAFGFGLYSLITTESFPSGIKTTGTGVVEAMSNLGNMASPFVVTLADKFDLQSMFIGGIVCLFGGLVMFLSKETLVVVE